MNTKRIVIVFLLLLFGLSGCLFVQNPRELRLYQDEQNIAAISRVIAAWNESGLDLEIVETAEGELLAPALQALRDLPCLDPRYEPLDFRGGECFLIQYTDGSYQLLDLYTNDYYDKDDCLQQSGGQEYDEARFHSLWDQGFGTDASK